MRCAGTSQQTSAGEHLQQGPEALTHRGDIERWKQIDEKTDLVTKATKQQGEKKDRVKKDRKETNVCSQPRRHGNNSGTQKAEARRGERKFY